MKTKSLLSIAIIAALPFAATAENISGAMYTAPATADTNHPAPTTNNSPSYGRVNIDTADQEHIATTAYVKGAYNSAIAAVNNVGELSEALYNTIEDIRNVIEDTNSAFDDKQDKLTTFIDGQEVPIAYFVEQTLSGQQDLLISSKGVQDAISDAIDDLDEVKQSKFILVSNQSSEVSEYVLDKPEFSNTIRNGYIASMVSEDSSLVTAGAVADVFASQRATIYTTWDTNATIQVPLSFVPVQP